MSNILTRTEIPKPMTWDLTPMYKNDEEWEKDFLQVPANVEKVLSCQGKLAKSAVLLNECLQYNDAAGRLIEKLYVYAHLRNDEDKTNNQYQGLFDRITGLYHDTSAKLSWIQPELLSINSDVINSFLADPILDYYRFALQQMLRYKPHTLSQKEEMILAMAGEILHAPYKAYGMLTNADLRFPEVLNDENQKIEMTHSNYSRLMESYNREVRKGAFKAMYATFSKIINTTAALLDANVKANVFRAKIRNYNSANEASLFGDNVNPAVYKNLVQTINDNLPVFHRYIRLRKQVLKLDDLNMYDMYVPLMEDVPMNIPWEQACEWVLESLKPLGEEYLSIAKTAFKNRWMDVLECRGKRSGAYSSGCYDSYPYMLLNYNQSIDHVFTLAHELGHSMHTYLASKNQGYCYASYPIILAEVASTTNELLLLDFLLSKFAGDENLKKYLVNHYCDNFKSTVFRQVQFAEFELVIHEKVENNIPLTVEELDTTYYEVNKKYYGPDIIPDEDIKHEWARIPHFYYNFYVYKYATGFSAANRFYENIKSGDQKKIDAYLGFLKSGGSKEPLEIIKTAGVDLSDPLTVQAGINKFGILIDQLTAMLK